MTEDQRKRIESLFHEALALSEDRRQAFLSEACPDDPEIRRQVSALISNYDKAGEFFAKMPDLALRPEMDSLPPRFKPGETLGPYESLSLFGRGGMGEVYLARDPRLGRKVAIKVLPRSFASRADLVERFRREAQAASALNRPNILTIYEFGREDDLQYMVTEFVEGKSLRELIGQVSPEQALEYARQIGEALAAAHAAGIVHRDIKPENIMVRSDGYIKVLDFGLAKLADLQLDSTAHPPQPVSGHAGATIPGALMGTLNYMSPEQARGDSVDQRTDIWSWGVVLYEMLAGRRPFDARTPDELLTALDRHLPPASKDKQLKRVLARALAPEPQERYPDIPAALQDLARIRGRFVRRALNALVRTFLPNEDKKFPWKAWTAVTIALVMLTIAAYRATKSWSDDTVRLLSILRLTRSGNAVHVACSPDGNYIAYVAREAAGQALRVIHMKTKNDVEIIPPAPVQYLGLELSKNGSIYYVTTQQAIGKLYRVPVLGGRPTWVADDVDSAAGLSPDETRFVFLRHDPAQDTTSLILRSVNEEKETRLTTLKWPEYFVASPVWAPDGNTVQFAGVLHEASTGAGPGFRIVSLRVKDGKEDRSVPEPWYWMGKPVWLNGRAIAASAAALGSNRGQIMQLNWSSALVSPITQDTSNYRDLSATVDSREIVTLQVDAQTAIWMLPISDQSKARPVTSGGRFHGISWTPSGTIVSRTETNDRPGLWFIDPNTKEQKPIPQETYVEQDVQASPDGKYLLDFSNRDGAFRLWRFDLDGSHSVRLTSQASDESTIAITSDSKWVIYTALGARYSLWEVPMDGGAPRQITDHDTRKPAVSPDGRRIACEYYVADSQEWTIAVLDRSTGKPVKFFPKLPAGSDALPVHWSADGKHLWYVATDENQLSNIWEQPLDGGVPRPLTHFTDDRVFAFAPSPDGKALALVRGKTTSDVVLMTLK